MDIRLPVVSRRRWVQRTAFGAAEVPEVNNNAHSRSTSPSPRSGAPASLRPRRASVLGGVERSREGVAAPRRVVAVGEAVRDEHTSGQVDERESVGELGLMARFGDDELQVRVRHVAGEVLPEPRVVQAGHRHPREPGAAQGEDVVGGVVEQHADVRRTRRVQPGLGRGQRSAPPRRTAPHASRSRRRNGERDVRRTPRRCGAAGPLRQRRGAGPRRVAAQRAPARLRALRHRSARSPSSHRDGSARMASTP